MTVSVGEQDVPLTVTEFRLLEHLARNPGRVLSREQLLAVLWRGPGSATPRAIDVYIRRVRAKIEHDPENPVYLTTVRGTGYRLNAPNTTEIQDLGA
jgi:two-component system phosphate regulon response regulator PhoB